MKQRQWSELGVCDELKLALQNEVKWASPTEIQSEAIPAGLAGKDVIGVAETGSGKTGAFAIPILQKLLERNTDSPQKIGILFAVVIAPTRELVSQIKNVFTILSKAIGGNDETIMTMTGGREMKYEARKISQKPEIVIAAPGRIIDHLKNTKGFNLRSVEFSVFDEADRLIESLDFEEAVSALLQYLPKNRTTFLFSATMSANWEELMRAVKPDAVRIKISDENKQKENKDQSGSSNNNIATHRVNKNIVQWMVPVPSKKKYLYLISYLDSKRVSFCITNSRPNELLPNRVVASNPIYYTNGETNCLLFYYSRTNRASFLQIRASLHCKFLRS